MPTTTHNTVMSNPYEKEPITTGQFGKQLELEDLLVKRLNAYSLLALIVSLSEVAMECM